jgi:hypothetical protein
METVRFGGTGKKGGIDQAARVENSIKIQILEVGTQVN